MSFNRQINNHDIFICFSTEGQGTTDIFNNMAESESTLSGKTRAPKWGGGDTHKMLDYSNNL